MAKEVAPGVVYAVDINPDLLTHIEKSAKEAGLANVKTVLATEGDPRLPEPLDLVFLCDVLHLMDDPELYLKGLDSHVRPEGRVAIISFVGKGPPVGNPFSAEQLERWMEQAGFSPVERHDFIPHQYLMIFERS
jgi:ubiquinone/menaquinone biosynthesis C-methylase UbiE